MRRLSLALAVQYDNLAAVLCLSHQDATFTLSVPLGVVSRVDKVGGIRSSGENAYALEIVCKVLPFASAVSIN